MLSTKILAFVPLVSGLELSHESFTYSLSGEITIDEASSQLIELGTPPVSVNYYETDDYGHGYSEFHSTNSDVKDAYDTAVSNYGTCSGGKTYSNSDYTITSSFVDS